MSGRVQPVTARVAKQKHSDAKKPTDRKGIGIANVQKVLRRIGRLKGLSLGGVCRLLKIPGRPEQLTTKQVSGYMSVAKRYLEKSLEKYDRDRGLK